MIRKAIIVMLTLAAVGTAGVGLLARGTPGSNTVEAKAVWTELSRLEHDSGKQA